MAKEKLTEDKAEDTPAGGVLVGKRKGQTMIHNKGSLSGYLVGRTHSKGGIDAVNTSTGQPLNMQGGEVIITAPAVADQTKNEFNGKMMTNREVLSTINEKGGGVSFAKGGDIPKNIKRTGASYKYGGKIMTDHEIYKHITREHLAEGMTLSQIAKKHKVSLKELQKQVDLGMKAESEHTSSKREQMKIVKDHLFKNHKYYTLLKKFRLENGGRVHRESLIRDTKSGNTPARDLNNYNDVLDLEADGMVGGETGIYARGGKVNTYDYTNTSASILINGGTLGLPKVAYVRVTNSGASLSNLVNNEYNSYIEFAESVESAYKQIRRAIRTFISLTAFDENGGELIEVSTSISSQKNTVRNFNPFTGNYKNLEKSLAYLKPITFKNFNWEDWFLSRVKPSNISPTITSKTNVPKGKILTKDELLGCKIWIGDDLDLLDKVMAKLIEIGILEDDRGKNKGYKTDIHILIYSNDFVIYKDSKKAFDEDKQKEIFPVNLGINVNNVGVTPTATATTTSLPIDLKQTKIWIGDNPALSEKIQKRAFELGWKFFGTKNLQRTQKPALFFTDINSIGWFADKKDFDDFNDFKEIFASDLFEKAPSQTNTQITPLKDDDWVKKFTADLDNLVVLPDDIDFAILPKERKDLNDLLQLLPSFQQSKYAIERAKILKEIKKLHYKLTYEGFLKPNEALSSDADLFTPQGLLDYYFTQATQNPTAELEPACKLITPNGEKSKLPMSAYLNVRTSQFKNWFGDWEKAYENGNYVNCSKMIDPDTKEPKIYFHGVRKYVPNFGQFSNMGQGVVRPYGAFEPPTFPASYFAGEEDYAKFYGGVAENLPTPSAEYKPFIYKVFLSVKNPISLLPLDFMLSYKDFMDYIYVGYGVKVEPNQELLRVLNNDLTKKNPMWIYVRRDIGFIEKLKDYGYDAIFQMGDIPTFLPNGEVEPDRTKHLQEVEYLTFNPSQVKSATVKKSFYFDFFNDIRFKNGGYVRI